MLQQTRRQFCKRTGQTISLTITGAALGTIFEGCSIPTGPSNVAALPIVSASVTNNSVAMNIDGNSPLATVGNAVLVQTTIGDVLVARTGPTAFTALSARCTHQQICTVTGFGSQTYVCPCHGSEFDTSGRVVQGPASSPLPQFATRFDGTVLTITV